MNTDLLILLLLLSDPKLLSRLKPVLQLLENPALQTLFSAKPQAAPQTEQTENPPSGSETRAADATLSELLESFRKAAQESSPSPQ